MTDIAPAKPKRKKSKSPTQRALEECRKLGFTAAVVERWNPHARVRQDLFGCIDVVAMFPGVGILAVQATTAANHAARRTKSIAEPHLRTWLESGGRFEVWSYRKAGAKDKRKLWTLWREEITLDHLPAEPPSDLFPVKPAVLTRRVAS